MMVRADPWRGCGHGDGCENNSDNTPCEDDSGSVLGDMVLESAHDDPDEPGEARDGTSRVDTTNVLDKSSPENSDPQGRPLSGAY